jgi:phosphoglucomutase
MIPCLLAAEMTAKTGKDPHARHLEHIQKYGDPAYGRIETPADARVRKLLGSLSPEMVKSDNLAGEKIEKVLTNVPGNGAPIGGLKICAHSGWFAVRPSGTEDIYKIYAESFKGADHLATIQQQAVEIVNEITK